MRREWKAFQLLVETLSILFCTPFGTRSEGLPPLAQLARRSIMESLPRSLALSQQSGTGEMWSPVRLMHNMWRYLIVEKLQFDANTFEALLLENGIEKLKELASDIFVSSTLSYLIDIDGFITFICYAMFSPLRTERREVRRVDA